MNTIELFTDGSVNNKTKIGYGAYLAIYDKSTNFDQLKESVKIKRFQNTSSTKLELQTLLRALEEIDIQHSHSIVIYTDSQNIIKLPERRNRFEGSNYYSKNGKRLNNYILYQDFFRITDKLNYKIIKIRGHKRSNEKDRIDNIFTIVDRASRNATRQDS